MQEHLNQGEKTAAASPLAAFTGGIQRTGLSLPYTIGLAVVAFAMVLLPTIYIGLIGLTAWGILYYFTHAAGLMEGGGNGLGKLIVFLGPPIAGGILVFFMLKPLFAQRPKRKELPSLDAAKEPLLFAFVEHICTIVGAPKPARIDVDCQVNASASFRRGLWSKDLVLTVGLPLAGGLTMREFAGVLAHEFGHFAQGAGMRLTYVIRNINVWFARVVYERDAWDEKLRRTAKSIDFRIGIILHAARGCVWLTRRILWVLMHAGNGISCFMLRQMEFDADSYEAKVAGSDAFESTMVRIQLLNAATQVAFDDVRTSWAGHRLPENLPLLIDHKARFLPSDFREKVLESGKARKTGWFDTHPCDADRNNAVRRLAEPGIFRLEDSATGLFSNFAEVSKVVTRHQYEKNWELKFTENNLVSSDEMLRESAAQTEADAAIREFYGDVNISLVPLLKEGAPPPPQDPDEAKMQWQEMRERSASLKAEADKVSAECAKLQLKLINLTSARHLTSANFKIVPKDFGVPTKATSVGEQQSAVLHEEMETTTEFNRHMAQLAEFVALVRMRVLLAIKLAPNAPKDNDPGLETIFHCLVPVSEAMWAVSQIGMRLRAFTVLAQNRGNHSNPGVVNAQMNKLAEELKRLLNDVRARVQGIPYPFPHPRGQMSIADYTQYEKPCDNEWEKTYRDSNACAERMYALHYRLLGKLLMAAEAAERELGAEARMENGG